MAKIVTLVLQRRCGLRTGKEVGYSVGIHLPDHFLPAHLNYCLSDHKAQEPLVIPHITKEWSGCLTLQLSGGAHTTHSGVDAEVTHDFKETVKYNYNINYRKCLPVSKIINSIFYWLFLPNKANVSKVMSPLYLLLIKTVYLPLTTIQFLSPN